MLAGPNKTPGTYLLLLELERQCAIQIGRSRQIDFAPGLYCYVGSALGPGGLRARLSHHVSPSPRKHWHIDYLLIHARITGALVIESSERIECKVASWIAGAAETCVSGFGASDCHCKSHLFLIRSDFSALAFIGQAEAKVNARFIPPGQLRKLRA